MIDASDQKVSVIDVAARAGVSLGTVSNVMNRPDTVRARTRAKVEQAMADLGFVRNGFASGLRSGHSKTLGYVMLDARNPFFTDVAEGIENVAAAADLSTFTCNSNQDPERERAHVERLLEQRVRGVLLTPVDPDASWIDDVGIPLVLVDRTGTGTQRCSVAVDDVLGGSLAIEHLVDRGHERVALVGGPDTLGQVRDRWHGARDAWRKADREEKNLVPIATSALTVAEGRAAGERLAGIPADRRPTAAFCANDLLALGLLQHAVSHGIAVPDQLAIVGYDDIEFAAAAAVPLTSVRQPRQELGRTAAEMLLAETTDPDHRHRQVQFDPELIARASTLG